MDAKTLERLREQAIAAQRRKESKDTDSLEKAFIGILGSLKAQATRVADEIDYLLNESGDDEGDK